MFIYIFFSQLCVRGTVTAVVLALDTKNVIVEKDGQAKIVWYVSQIDQMQYVSQILKSNDIHQSNRWAVRIVP